MASESTAALTSATESSTGTTASATSSTPSPNFSSTTIKKETTSSGQVITTTTTTSSTTVTTSTSNTSNSATSTSSTASNTANSGVSTTTISTTEGANGPVTVVTTDNGVNTTTTSTAKDATTGLTTVSTTTKSDANTSGSTSSTTRATSGSSVSTDESSTTTTASGTSQGTSSAAGALTSTSTTTTSSSAGATMEGASSSTVATSTGSATGTPTTSDTNSVAASENTVNGATSTTSTGTVTESGSTNSATSTGATTASSSAGQVSTTTSTTTGSAAGASNAAVATTTSSTTGTNSGTSSTTTTSSSTNGATAAAATESSGNSATISSSTGSTAVTDGAVSTETNASSSKTGSSATETSTSSTVASSAGSTNTASAAGSSSTTGSSSTSSRSSSSSSSSSSSLVSWFTSNFRDEETQLVVGATSSTTTAGSSHQVCDGRPALVTRSNTETPNGGCPDELTALNASCTCITGNSATATSWSFLVTSESWNSTTSTSTRSLTQSSSDELAINTIRPIWVSSSVETLVIEGAEDTPANITFINENRVASGSSLALVRSTSNSTNVSTLSLYNLDLNSIAETNSDFVPATVTNLTLRNCNISTLGGSFTRDWSWLQYLDLSLNNLNSEYVGGSELRELNLSHNALAVFPAETLNSSGLEALYIQGNDITDFNVSQDQFEQIQGLAAFTADQPDSSTTCQDGAWQSAHGTTFCVLGASTAAVPDSAQSSGSDSDDGGGLGLLAYWLIAGAIIVFFLLLLVIWQRRRHSRERESSPIVSPEAVEPTTPKYNANDAFGDALNRDAAAAAPAAVVVAGAVAAGAYPGYGRSHGNSVDSEDTALGASLASNPTLAACRLDYGEVTLGRCISRGGFGLVFVGSYRGRQVAVKKIRNERDVEREQVEQFVREISLISGLNHPRIVEFIGACWTTPAELSAVTELMERGDLRDVTRRFKRRGYRLTWEAHKTVIALHIAEALTYLHGLSPTVIHRDLKAKNVMLNADMEAKLSDFGIARERSFYDGSEHMTVGIGTSFWIAPEVLLGRDYDERADIYSFGVVLSEIDTDDYPYWNAQHPPQGKVQENEILRLVARGAKRPAFSDDCPPTILDLAARCLRADPEERPSASEIVVYLQQLVQDRNSSASFSSIRPGNSFDFSTRSTNNSSPTRTAPANTIVNLRSSGQQIQQNQAMSVPSSAAAAFAAGKRSKKTTTTKTTTKAAASSAGVIAHEVVVSPPQVTHKVVRTKLPPKGKRTTTTTTTTTRRAEQGSASVMTGGHFTTGVAADSSDGDNSGRSFGSESVPSSQSNAGLPYAGPTSPASLRANHQAAMDNLNQQRQLSSSSGEEEKKHEATAVGIDRRGQKWVVYEDVKEL